MSANGPDPANVAEPETSSATNTPAATIQGRKDFKLGLMSITVSLSKLAWEAAAEAAELLEGKKEFAETHERIVKWICRAKY